jgi:hypothetical protein
MNDLHAPAGKKFSDECLVRFQFDKQVVLLVLDSKSKQSCSPFCTTALHQQCLYCRRSMTQVFYERALKPDLESLAQLQGGCCDLS